MPYYRSLGQVPRKRHVQFRKPDGGLYREELMGTEGFSSDSALLYHTHAPTDVVAVGTWDIPGQDTTPNHPLKPRLVLTHSGITGPAPMASFAGGWNSHLGVLQTKLAGGEVRDFWALHARSTEEVKEALGADA